MYKESLIAKVVQNTRRVGEISMPSLKSLRRKILIHVRRIYVMILNFLFGHNVVFYLIGLISRVLFRKGIKSVFLLYPGHRRYAEAYVYDWYRAQMQWKPRLVGLLWQNGRISLTFGISACDEDIWSDSGENLKKVYNRIEGIKKKLGANQATFAGILPGVFMAKNIMSHSVEREVTVPAVVRAVNMVKEKENMPLHTAIIVLGGSGFIGNVLVQALRKDHNGALFSLDIGNSSEFSRIRVGPAIVINVTKKGVLKEYVSSMHSGMVVINEVYPPPNNDLVRKIKAIGAKIFHINGIKGGALPAFPHDYAGGIPCCAGHLPENLEDMEIIISEL